MHHHQYMSPLNGSSSSSTTGSPTGTAVTTNMPLIASIANVKDSRWLTLEVCREYQRGKCSRSEQECKFAHPPTHVEVNSGKVIACFDSLKVCSIEMIDFHSFMKFSSHFKIMSLFIFFLWNSTKDIYVDDELNARTKTRSTISLFIFRVRWTSLITFFIVNVHVHIDEQNENEKKSMRFVFLVVVLLHHWEEKKKKGTDKW